MLIRSQNKISLVKFENIVININNINGKEIICWSQMNPGEDEYISLGHYSTKAKTMKVLDMIQESYTNEKVAQILSYGLRMVPTEEINEAGKIIKNKIQSSTVFQMPEDSEVEV